MTADQDEAREDPKDAAHEDPKDAAHEDPRDAAGDEPQDAKARFRAALDRKQATARREGEARRNTGAVHGSEVAGSKRRTYRRKTG